MPGPVDAAGRSTFVTAVAWIFIVLGAFATLISILQNIMISVMFTEMPRMSEAQGTQDIPAFARFMMNNFRLFVLAFLVLSVVTLASAIGLLKRMNWARLAFIGLMALGILWNIGGLVVMYFVFSSMPMPNDVPADIRMQHDLMSKIMMAFMVVISVAFAALFAWVIKRLSSEQIKSEFAAS